jgi:hypothetical protein
MLGKRKRIGEHAKLLTTNTQLDSIVNRVAHSRVVDGCTILNPTNVRVEACATLFVAIRGNLLDDGIRLTIAEKTVSLLKGLVVDNVAGLVVSTRGLRVAMHLLCYLSPAVSDVGGKDIILKLARDGVGVARAYAAHSLLALESRESSDVISFFCALLTEGQQRIEWFDVACGLARMVSSAENITPRCAKAAVDRLIVALSKPSRFAYTLSLAVLRLAPIVDITSRLRLAIRECSHHSTRNILMRLEAEISDRY